MKSRGKTSLCSLAIWNQYKHHRPFCLFFQTWSSSRLFRSLVWTTHLYWGSSDRQSWCLCRAPSTPTTATYKFTDRPNSLTKIFLPMPLKMLPLHSPSSRMKEPKLAVWTCCMYVTVISNESAWTNVSQILCLRSQSKWVGEPDYLWTWPGQTSWIATGNANPNKLKVESPLDCQYYW